MNIKFKKKLFFYKLITSVRNSKTSFNYKKGWIIKLNIKDESIGFGEISPLKEKDLSICEKEIDRIPENFNKDELIEKINNFHPCIQSGINSAIGEMEGTLNFKDKYKFNKIDESAILLNSWFVIDEIKKIKRLNILDKKIITIKWKVGLKNYKIEEKILEDILNLIGSDIRLRIDANGAWNRKIANRWAEILKNDKNIDWLEQPLAIDDIEGLRELNKKIPVALDESLIKYPKLIKSWDGWQIRRPSQESNPLMLLKELNTKKSMRCISSSFETGIGRRLLFHLSSLQLIGPTPKVPGLALKQMPDGILFKNNPELVWNNL